jgi:hypothetical protein
MASSGIREQWDLNKAMIKDGGYELRPTCLHQLSLNGSLLLARNHDQRWLAELARVLEREPTSWTDLSGVVAALPGPLARKALWRASYRWWQQSTAGIGALIDVELRYRSELSPAIPAFLRRLETVSGQLRDLQWCETGADQRPLRIIGR